APGSRITTSWHRPTARPRAGDACATRIDDPDADGIDGYMPGIPDAHAAMRPAPTMSAAQYESRRGIVATITRPALADQPAHVRARTAQPARARCRSAAARQRDLACRATRVTRPRPG